MKNNIKNFTIASISKVFLMVNKIIIFSVSSFVLTVRSRTENRHCMGSMNGEGLALTPVQCKCMYIYSGVRCIGIASLWYCFVAFSIRPLYLEYMNILNINTGR